MKFLRAIVTMICLGARTHLQTIRADDAAARYVLHQQVIANGVEGVGIKTRRVRGCEALVQLEVKDFVAQNLGGADFLRVARQSRGVVRRRAHQETRGFESGTHTDMVTGVCYGPVPATLIILHYS